MSWPADRQTIRCSTCWRNPKDVPAPKEQGQGLHLDSCGGGKAKSRQCQAQGLWHLVPACKLTKVLLICLLSWHLLVAANSPDKQQKWDLP